MPSLGMPQQTMHRPERSATSFVDVPAMTARTPRWLPFAPLLALLVQVPGQQPAPQGQPTRLQQRSGVLQVAEPDASEREMRMTPVVRAVQRAADSVVSIYLQAAVPTSRGPITEGQGSGVILDDSGLVITNWHVVAPTMQNRVASSLGIEVKLRDGRARKAQLLSSSRNHDLALLQLRLEGDEKVKPIEIGRSSDLMIGETLVAIGNPQGHANTVTSGVLSAIGRQIQVRTPDNDQLTYGDLLQTDAAINQGNSGGALLDITGKLVGINNAMAMGAENIGFAIPVDVVREVFEKELMQSSSFAMAADSAWLGIDVADQDGAVVVTAVQAASPAAKAGVASGDVLLRIGEQPVRSSLDYQRQLVAARVRQPFPLALRRGDRELSLAPVPTTMTNKAILSLVGTEVEEVTATGDEDLVRRATLALYRGFGRRPSVLLPSVVRVVQVQPDSPAEAIGLRAGDLLLAANDSFRGRLNPILSAHDLALILQVYTGRSLRISVLRGDEELEGTLDVRGRALR